MGLISFLEYMRIYLNQTENFITLTNCLTDEFSYIRKATLETISELSNYSEYRFLSSHGLQDTNILNRGYHNHKL